MARSKFQLEETDEQGLDLGGDNIDKNEYIKSLEISVQLLQREVENLRKQLTESRVKSEASLPADDENPYKLLSGAQNRKELIEKLDRVLDKHFDFLENSVFEIDHKGNLIPYYYDEKLEEFYKYTKNLEEDGIIDWVSETSELQIIPNLDESTETTIINSVIHFVGIKGFRDSVFVAKTAKNKNDFTNERVKSLKELLSAAAILLDNVISHEEIQKINRNIEEKRKSGEDSSNVFEIATNVIESIYQSLGIIDANVKMIESGIGNTKRRIDIINDNSNKIRETGKKFIGLLNSNENTEKSAELYEIIEDVIFLVRSQLLRDAIKIVNEVDQKIKFEGDIAFVEKLILNVIFIIRDTLRDGGTIRISGSKAKSYKIIRIADDGIGLPVELVEKFNEEREIEGEMSKTFDKVEAVRDQLKQRGSKLELSSKERAGTTFAIYIKK